MVYERNDACFIPIRNLLYKERCPLSFSYHHRSCFSTSFNRFCNTSIGLPHTFGSCFHAARAYLALLSLRSALHRSLNVGSETDREESAQGGQSCSSAAASVFTPWRIASSSVLA